MNAAQHQNRIVDFLNFKTSIADPEIKFYDPADIFCPATGACITIDKTMVPFYFDEGHLTLTGARKLEGMMRDILLGLN